MPTGSEEYGRLRLKLGDRENFNSDSNAIHLSSIEIMKVEAMTNLKNVQIEHRIGVTMDGKKANMKYKL